MKIGFLILAHRYPNQLKSLIESLLSFPNARVYLHIDKKSKGLIETINDSFTGDSRVVILTERYPVYWGSFNQIQATFALMKKAKEFNSEDYYMLISGQDMLIKKPMDLLSFFSQHKGKQFLMNFKLPDPQWNEGGLNRLAYFHIDIPGRSYLSNRITSLIHRFQDLIGYKRKVYFEQYGGSNWFNLDAGALNYIVDFVNQNPKYLNSFKYSRCADEIFVQSVLMNSPFKDEVINDDLRYVDWSSGPEYPRILRESDLEKMHVEKNKFFARKFDANVDDFIIKKLKEFIEN